MNSGSERRVRFLLPPEEGDREEEDDEMFHNIKVNGVTFGQLKKLTAQAQVKLVRCDPEVEAMVAMRRRRRQLHPFRCDQCSKRFVNQRGLRRHRQEVHLGLPNNPSAYRCSTCGEVYSNQTSFHSHCKGHLSFQEGGLHPNEKPYRCSGCGKRCSLVSNLYTHTKSVASRAKPECQAGADAYRRKDNRPVPKPFRCAQCPRSFALQQDLAYHVGFHKLEAA